MPSIRLRRALVAFGLAVLAVVLVGCGGAPADTPSGVVRQAVERLKAKDIEGMSVFACAAQRETIAQSFGFAAGQLGTLAPGLELGDILDAVDFDVSRVTYTETTVDGDRAEVAMGGTMGMSFDPEKVRDLMRAVGEQQGVPVTDEMLDLLVNQLTAFTQNIPIDQSLSLVREDGAWRICGQS